MAHGGDLLRNRADLYKVCYHHNIDRLIIGLLFRKGFTQRWVVDSNKRNLTVEFIMKSVWYIDQVEFRRLQEQVRDVSMNLKNKFRTSAYQVLNLLYIYSSTVQTYKFNLMNLRYKR